MTKQPEKDEKSFKCSPLAQLKINYQKYFNDLI